MQHNYSPITAWYTFGRPTSVTVSESYQCQRSPKLSPRLVTFTAHKHLQTMPLARVDIKVHATDSKNRQFPFTLFYIKKKHFKLSWDYLTCFFYSLRGQRGRSTLFLGASSSLVTLYFFCSNQCIVAYFNLSDISPGIPVKIITSLYLSTFLMYNNHKTISKRVDRNLCPCWTGIARGKYQLC